ncbi:MAG: YlmH/Sll1252 family protein [Ruminococcus sp.]
MAKSCDDNDILISRISDLYYLACERNKPTFTQFLNEQEISVCIEGLKSFGITDYSFYGGYDNSQRKILGFFARDDDFPLSIIEFKYRKQDALNHRQFMGTILSTGLKRSVVGDIICLEGVTYVFILSSQADYVMSQVDRVARVGVKSKIINLSDFDYTPRFSYKEYSVSSLRLDNIVAVITGLSREKTRNLILGGNVFVNYLQQDNISGKINTQDVLSIRKYGKFILEDLCGQTKKGRYKIIIKQYI